MFFNSLDFALFLPIVFLLYWSLNNVRLIFQNFLILASSYIFYGWWDWRFLSLILISTVIDFSVGLSLKSIVNPKRRKILLLISILANIGFLGFFKYYNFFLENFITAFSFFGNEINPHSLNIILPVGISFYTFQTLSYTIDIYNRKLEPTNNFVEFASFVSFFPQLVAGPIERASNLLPQFQKPRSFNYNNSVDGLRQILWGLFKKVVIADNAAEYANLIFNHSTDFTGSTLILGALFFSFQIYGDFSGYSDIAIGTSRLFGFSLRRNFAFPYFSRDIAEFWRRWHISLSTWFRDYLYIPIGGSRTGLFGKIRNTFTIFLVSGFWHGANWTFVIWGAIHAIYFLPLQLLKVNRINTDIVAKGRFFPSAIELIKMLITFILTTFAWIFFRAESLEHAKTYIICIFDSSLFSPPDLDSHYQVVVSIIIAFIIIEWIGREGDFALSNISRIPVFFRWMFYLLTILMLFVFTGKEQPFIYFQF
jgi:alginate O-acetyltransferase complex protein AlgI